jgi:hypothetical protein
LNWKQFELQNHAGCVGELPGIQPVYFRRPAHSLVNIVTDLSRIFSNKENLKRLVPFCGTVLCKSLCVHL